MTRERVVPMIHVPDVRRTLEWYRDIGFQVDATYDDGGEDLTFAFISFGSTQVMLDSGGTASESPRREVDLYVHTSGVDALYERLRDRVDTFYGSHELIIRDLNRFWITFGEAARTQARPG